MGRIWDFKKQLLRANEASALAGLLPHEFPPRKSRLMRGGLRKAVNTSKIWWGRKYEPGALSFVHGFFGQRKEMVL